MSSDVPRDIFPIREERPKDFSLMRDFNPRQMYESDQSSKPASLPVLRETDLQLESTQKFTGFGLEITSSVVGTLISHPCLVLRRQCQVNKKALRYHLTPFSLVPVIIRLQSRQGVKSLWKGAGGIFIVRGFAVVVETIIAELTPFPREVSSRLSVKHVFQHLLLKSITFAILTPFYCSSLIETVQSDIASEKPGVFDCLLEGLRRLLRWGTPQSTRLLPVWQLVGPTVAYEMLNYVLSSVVQSLCLWILSVHLQGKQNKGVLQKKLTAASKYLDELSASQFGHMVAEILLFPAETVLNRLYLQGTRTIIDNLDTGLSVLPVISKYEGAVDCFHTIIHEEGKAGLYKGFGALILEYLIHAAVLKTAKVLFREALSAFGYPDTETRNMDSQTIQK